MEKVTQMIAMLIKAWKTENVFMPNAAAITGSTEVKSPEAPPLPATPAPPRPRYARSEAAALQWFRLPDGAGKLLFAGQL